MLVKNNPDYWAALVPSLVFGQRIVCPSSAKLARTIGEREDETKLKELAALREADGAVHTAALLRWFVEMREAGHSLYLEIAVRSAAGSPRSSAFALVSQYEMEPWTLRGDEEDVVLFACSSASDQEIFSGACDAVEEACYGAMKLAAEAAKKISQENL